MAFLHLFIGCVENLLWYHISYLIRICSLEVHDFRGIYSSIRHSEPGLRVLCEQEPDLVRLMSEEEGSTKLTETPDLLILSNDIPTSPTEELVIAGEEEEDPGKYYSML